MSSCLLHSYNSAIDFIGWTLYNYSRLPSNCKKCLHNPLNDDVGYNHTDSNHCVEEKVGANIMSIYRVYPGCGIIYMYPSRHVGTFTHLHMLDKHHQADRYSYADVFMSCHPLSYLLDLDLASNNIMLGSKSALRLASTPRSLMPINSAFIVSSNDIHDTSRSGHLIGCPSMDYRARGIHANQTYSNNYYYDIDLASITYIITMYVISGYCV